MNNLTTRDAPFIDPLTVNSDFSCVRTFAFMSQFSDQLFLTTSMGFNGSIPFSILRPLSIFSILPFIWLCTTRWVVDC